MCDCTPHTTGRNLTGKFSKAGWISKCSRLLAVQRNGFRAVLWAVLVNFILFGLFLTWATPVYETNDDLMMQMIASGFYTGHSDAHLVFTNILIGWALQFLYGTWAGCNWYFVYLMVAHFAALTAIAFMVVSRRGGWLFTWLYVGFFLIVEFRILLHLQFTTTAFLTGVAGLLLLVDGLKPGHPVHWPKVATGIVFAALMCLIREQVLLLLVVIASPFLLERLGLSGWRRLAGIGLAFAGIFLALHGINRWAYQRDAAWAEFSEYNQIRGEIHVTPLAKFIPEAAPAVGWSKNDGWMFSKFYFPDPEVYAGVPRIRHLLDQLKILAHNEPKSARTIPPNFLFLVLTTLDDTVWLMYLAILVAGWCIIAASPPRRRYVATLLAYGCLFAALSFYFLKTARLPERLAYNFPLFIHAICLYWATGFNRPPRPSTTRSGWPDTFFARLWRIKALRMAVLVFVTLWAAFNLSQLAQSLWEANVANQKLKQVSRKILQPIRTLLPGQPSKTPILIAMPLDSVLEQSIFFYTPSEKVPFYVMPYGWITHSPLFNQILEEHHLRAYSLSLLDRPDVFFMMGKRWIQPLKIFYREHYGLDVRFDMILDTDRIPSLEDCHLHLYQAHASGEKAMLD
jgi:hypothetical protein